MKFFWILTTFCTILGPCVVWGQNAFYSNDLSQQEIWSLVDDRDKWKREAAELRKLLEAAKIPPAPDNALSDAEREKLRQSNQRLLSEKSKLEGLLALTFQNYQRALDEVRRLERSREVDQKKLLQANQRVEELLEIIQSQKQLLDSLQSKVDQLWGVVKAAERELLEKDAILRQAKLQISKNRTDVLMITHRRRNIKASFRDNNEALPYCYFKRTRKLLIYTGLFLEPDEISVYRSKAPRATFYLYALGSSTTIAVKRFDLEFSRSTLPSVVMASASNDTNVISSGKVVWGSGELDLKNKKIAKGDYYYLLEIDGRIMLTSNLELE